MTTRKMIVRAESRIVRAISFGVFWRLAPSTSAIIRSRKLSPGSAVTRTLIRSDRTRVPPVTALRSPPASRMTGADSPVMADSSTVATPSMISPSAGMISPAETTTRSPFRSRSAGTSSIDAVRPDEVGHGPGAGLSEGVGLGLAPAFGHGLGKVGEEHREPEPEGDLQDETRRLVPRSEEKARRWSAAAPTSVTNMTGFFSSEPGLSFLKESTTAWPMISRSKREWVLCGHVHSPSIQDLGSRHQEMLDDRAEGQGRQEGQRPDDQDRRRPGPR